MRKWLCLLLALMGCTVRSTNNIGGDFVGAPYVLSPLGEGAGIDDDPLIRLDAFDCTTFVETVLADANLDKLNRIRYQDGVIDFVHRNHFIETDWLINNRWLVQNVSAKYAPTRIRRVTISKKNWFKRVHGLDVSVDDVDAAIEYIPYENAQNISVDDAMVVLFIADNAKIRDTIGTDLAVVHMGLLMPDGVLRHASSKAGCVLDVNFADYVDERRQNKQNLGFVLLEIK